MKEMMVPQDIWLNRIWTASQKRRGSMRDAIKWSASSAVRLSVDPLNVDHDSWGKLGRDEMDLMAVAAAAFLRPLRLASAIWRKSPIRPPLCLQRGLFWPFLAAIILFPYQGLYQKCSIITTAKRIVYPRSMLKRGCMREWTIIWTCGTLTSPIWLKIGMAAGNDLKLSPAKYFLTFISKKIA